MGVRTRRRGGGPRRAPALVLAVALGVVVAPAAACTASTGAGSGVVAAVGAESQYADVVAQIGGRYVHVSSVLDNPNTDPHSYELSPSVAREVAQAQLVVQNGLGYDEFMRRMEAATPSPGRRVLVVQHLLGLPDSTPDPHLWYSPETMPRVASAVAAALSAIEPRHAAYFEVAARRFDDSLSPWRDAIAAFRAAHAGVAVTSSEPVADRLLQAMGADNLTPMQLQLDIMNGVDPAPQDITFETGLFTAHRVKLFCYNEQVVDALTSSLRQQAVRAGIPIVGVYETMPSGYSYQRWMLAETRAIDTAVSTGRSTEHL